MCSVDCLNNFHSHLAGLQPAGCSSPRITQLLPVGYIAIAVLEGDLGVTPNPLNVGWEPCSLSGTQQVTTLTTAAMLQHKRGGKGAWLLALMLPRALIALTNNYQKMVRGVVSLRKHTSRVSCCCARSQAEFDCHDGEQCKAAETR
jgi:hypothetical protein